MNKQVLVRQYLLLACLLVPVFLSAQSLLFTSDQPTQKLFYTNGHLYTLASGQVCQYEDFNKVNDCVVVPGRGELIEVGERAFIFFSENEILNYVNDELVRRDSLEDLIFTAKFRGGVCYLATASGLYSYDYTSGQSKLFAFGGKYVNDIVVKKDIIVAALDEAIVGLDSAGSVLWENKQYNLVSQLIQTPQGVAFVSALGEVVFLDEKGQQIRSWNSPFGKTEQLIVSEAATFLRTATGIYKVQGDGGKLLKAGRFETMLLLDHSLLLVEGADVLELDLSANTIPVEGATFSVFSDRADSYWIGQNQRISHLENGVVSQQIELPLSNHQVFVSAVVVSEQYIFAGTMGQGLLVFDRSGKLVKRVLNQDANNQNNIIQLKLLNGYLWVAYLNGVIRIDVDNLEINDNYDNLLGSNYLYCIEPVDDKRFYIGTSNEGVLYFDAGEVSVYLPGTSVYSLSLFEDKLYVGTERSGIFTIVNSSVQLLHEAKHVYALCALADRLVISEKEDVYVLGLSDQKMYPLSSGTLVSAQLNGVSDNERDIVLAFQNGLLEINKGQLSTLADIAILLNRPMQFNRIVEEENPIFSYDRHTISFSYYLNTSYQNKNVFFKYRLLGQDSTWRSTQQNQLDFYQLPPGEYSFEIDFGYTSAFAPKAQEKFDFTILPPFWLRWQFLAALGLAFTGLLLFIMRVRERRIKRKQERDKAQLQFEIHQLKQQVDPHFLFNSMSTLAALVEESPTQGVEALEKLSALYRRILACQEKELIELSEEIALVRDYFCIQQLRYEAGINLEIEVNPSSGMRVIPLSLQFLVENAIKHNVVSISSPLHIKIVQQGDYLIVSNNLNPKQILAPTSGFGLKNLEARYGYLSKLTFKVQKLDQHFTVHLPIIRD